MYMQILLRTKREEGEELELGKHQSKFLILNYTRKLVVLIGSLQSE